MGDGEDVAICLHGFPEHAYSWRHQMPLLARLGFRVWAPNLRGYGGTDSPPGASAYRLELLLDDLHALVRAAGGRRTLLIAHDWGGLLAWLLASETPCVIDDLIVVNMPHPARFLRELRRAPQLLKSWYIFFFQLPALPELVLRRGLTDLLTFVAASPPDLEGEVLELYRQNALRRGGLTSMINWYRALPRTRALAAYRPGRTTPIVRARTLLIWGDADIAFDNRVFEETEQFVETLSTWRVRGGSHCVHQQMPQCVNTVISEWLAKRG